MSAELEVVRRAAALMRERAEAANDGPWTLCPASDEYDDYGYGGEVRSPTLGGGEQDDLIASIVDYSDTPHIASWHPAVALAVADLLAAHIDRIEQTGFVGHGHTAMVALARTYLNEPDSSATSNPAGEQDG